MKIKRTDRLNSLLKEVLSEVIQRDVNDPEVSPFTSVSNVEITQDLHYAKVFISVIGSDQEKEKTLAALQKSAGFIGKIASKKVVMRFFPTLTFKLDTSVEKQMKIQEILNEIKSKETSKETD
jgi:ribosome-binding factor A